MRAESRKRLRTCRRVRAGSVRPSAAPRGTVGASWRQTDLLLLWGAGFSGLGLAIVLGALNGCSNDEGEASAEPNETTAVEPAIAETKKQTVGASGGQIVVDGASLTIPPGALSADVEVTVSKLSEEGADQVAVFPDGVEPTSSIFAFEPHGLGFEEPVRVELDHGASRLLRETAFAPRRGRTAWI